ncbi:DUF2057 family protein [Vibrio aestuarianus]|uniref:DUF2057 domain-containing protein n=1 Tax=Vibrio aestuarianus TaxID=28171 RepID=A0A9X4IQD1_9VIBR|nr:DUF2057 family protein [Vibrio aestuarianus]MDE1242922.1 DUF2057 domain-containing protein [Vibrio aestuarianus]
MTKNLYVVFSAAFIFSGFSHAATVTPSAGVSILYINGQQAEDKIGVNNLEEGFNQIVIKMDKNMSRSSNSDVFTSAPYVLSLDNVQGDVKIAHPQARSKMEAENAFKTDSPQWVVEQGGKALQYQQVALPGKSGMFPFMGLDGLVADYNKAQGINFVDGVLVTTASAVTVASASSVETKPLEQVSGEQASTHINAESQNLEQLKAWYLKSSAQERKTFRKWMIDQE